MVCWPTQVNVLHSEQVRVGIRVLLKPQFYLEHLLCGLAWFRRDGDESGATLNHIVHFEANWFSDRLLQVLREQETILGCIEQKIKEFFEGRVFTGLYDSVGVVVADKHLLHWLISHYFQLVFD